MKPRHKITKDYEANPRHLRRWELTIDWLREFDMSKMPNEVSQIIGKCLDCGNRTKLTEMMETELINKIENTTHDLNWKYGNNGNVYKNIFVFEVIEHLLNPLVFMKYLYNNVSRKGFVYLSTPINRPKWMRNKEWHFHEFNYNELEYLIDKAGFKIVDEKRINCTRWYYALTGFRPLLRVLGYDKNILIRMRRK